MIQVPSLNLLPMKLKQKSYDVSKHIAILWDNSCASPAFKHEVQALFCRRPEKVYVYSAVKNNFEFK